MYRIKISALAQARYPELEDRYENPLPDPCSLHIGQEWISDECTMPPGFCPSAWQSLYPYIFALASGADNLFDGWMKKPGTAMVSCSDGFRPMSFYLEKIESDPDYSEQNSSAESCE
ncbi:TIGR04076 family protein [Allobaculum sp. JKK-2023]|uniref:TIGR04076 family protein n=1 Tax=Allobaculum sp. JKK-2023 TaxID=3108943 RepID=UPI002B05FC9B|nr:TIGR04076 family protein [Allobaculum sp. JKK-2023]